MVCIVCLAIMAAAGFSVGVAIGETIERKLAKLMESGQLVHESDSVGTWEGVLRAHLSDGSQRKVRVTIRIFKDSGRVMISVHDHSLTQRDAERLEDEIAEALGAKILERRFPPTDSDGVPVCDHDHDEESAEEEPCREDEPAVESLPEEDGEGPIEVERRVPRR